LRARVSWVEELKARGDIWIASLEEIAAHLQKRLDAGEDLRRVRYPFYEKPVEEVKEFSATYRTFESPGWPC
jgi:hypothetical protein